MAATQEEEESEIFALIDGCLCEPELTDMVNSLFEEEEDVMKEEFLVDAGDGYHMPYFIRSCIDLDVSSLLLPTVSTKSTRDDVEKEEGLMRFPFFSVV